MHFRICRHRNLLEIGDFTPIILCLEMLRIIPGKKLIPQKASLKYFKTLGEPIFFFNEGPSERITNFMDSDRLPDQSFTVEMWILNHVNSPVGAMMCLRDKMNNDVFPWMLGYYGDEIIFQLSTRSDKNQIKSKIEKGWKKYWGHLVATYDGKNMKLYVNGELQSNEPVQGKLNLNDNTRIELSGYFRNEPFMQISNLVKAGRIYNGAMNQEQIDERFKNLQKEVEEGALFPEILHFNAGPYLHYSTQNSVNLIWETNLFSSAHVEYGTSLPLDKRMDVENPLHIHELTLDSLASNTMYYYQVVAKTSDGREMSSGILTFKTAVEPEDPFSFCILGDTESRPHINHQLGEMVWEEKPDFILHLGDITDGGKKPHKFEWNYEYFTGIVPVASRIPIFPVPGNGEGDLYWYKKYHKLPEHEEYYTFHFGNAQFFMINSNEKDELIKGGKQYEWLKKELSNSHAMWKFVAHHHCPVSSDENDFGNTWKGEMSTNGDPRFDDMKTLYEMNEVDVVFFGHVHSYERTYPLKDGMVKF